MTAVADVKVEEMEKPAEGRSLTRVEEARRAVSATSEITPNSAIELLHVALEKGTDVNSLDKLLTLHERIADRQAATEFAQAMAAFKAECRPILHNKKADFNAKSGPVKYTYASLDEIARTIDPILAKYGLSYSWDSKVEQGMLSCACTVRHVAGHAGPPSTFMLPIENSSVASPQQKVGMALTFAQRRTVTSALGITTADEDSERLEVDPTPINDDQVVHLDDLIRTHEVPRIRFLKMMEVHDLKEIRAVDYNSAISAIEDIRAAKARRAEG